MSEELRLRLHVTPQTVNAAIGLAHALLGKTNRATICRVFQTPAGKDELCICLPETLAMTQLDAGKTLYPDGHSEKPTLDLRFHWNVRRSMNLFRWSETGLPARIVDSAGQPPFPPADFEPLFSFARAP